MNAPVQFKLGNTYKRISPERAKLSRNGVRKIHDVTIFIDVVEGNPETIERVNFCLGPTFIPQKFICTTPIPISSPFVNGKVWRFSTRQQVYGGFTARINIIGRGGTVRTVSHDISFSRDAEQQAYDRRNMLFRENKNYKPIKMLKVPDRANFGIELELTSPTHMNTLKIASHVNENARRGGGGVEIDIINTWSAGRETSQNWKIVPDGSIVCSTVVPNCNKFELVSPVLSGGQGLIQVSSILKSLNSMQTRLKVNKSMGFHVHIDVSAFGTSQLVKICQQFVKYEEVFDMIMPPSRREGSTESQTYFQSNRQSVADSIERVSGTMTNRQCHDALGECRDIQSLVSLMNRSGRYYKLNMQNLITGRQPTIEFRQHSATVNYDKVSAWIRFCTLFCHNSARLNSPTPFRNGRSSSDKFDALFLFVVKDRALRDFYRKRRTSLSRDRGEFGNDACACCDECAVDTGSCM